LNATPTTTNATNVAVALAYTVTGYLTLRLGPSAGIE